MCKVVGKALYEYGLENNTSLRILSMHDGDKDAVDNEYFPADIFTGYKAAKASFVLQAVRAARNTDVILISHINLLLAAWLIKKRIPSTKIYLIAHGIEIWGQLPRHQQLMLKCCDKIIAVSSFTSNKIAQEQGIAKQQLYVLNNCIDPYLVRPILKKRNKALLQQYNIEEKDTVLFTLTRLSLKDRYKGYDFVIYALKEILNIHPHVKYILGGGYDPKEKIYLDNIIKNNGLQNKVIITGYLPDDALAAHFSLADIYVMPSIKEGFGIVFIEAMYYGVPVIAANTDGSVDALLNGALGVLIPPENVECIVDAMAYIISLPAMYQPNDELLMANFGYEAYKRKWERLLSPLDTERGKAALQ